MSTRQAPGDGTGYDTAGHATASYDTTSHETPGRPAARTVAGRRHQPWASRWNGGRPEGQAAAGRAAGQEVLSYLIAGMLAYGAIGWVIAHFTHIELFFPVGLAVGMAISLGWVVYRYGRQ